MWCTTGYNPTILPCFVYTQKHGKVKVLSSHFLSKIARDGIDSADMWYRKVSKSMQHHEHVHV